MVAEAHACSRPSFVDGNEFSSRNKYQLVRQTARHRFQNIVPISVSSFPSFGRGFDPHRPYQTSRNKDFSIAGSVNQCWVSNGPELSALASPSLSSCRDIAAGKLFLNRRAARRILGPWLLHRIQSCETLFLFCFRVDYFVALPEHRLEWVSPKGRRPRQSAVDPCKHCGLSIAESRHDGQSNSLGRKRFRVNRRCPKSGGSAFRRCTTKRVLDLLADEK